MSLSVAVITSTRGRETIKQANESIRIQSYPATHYVFAHGRDCWEAVEKNMRGIDNAQVVNLPRANGGNGYGMAPVFAMAPFVVDEDIMFYLDDDNWYEPNHIESLVDMIEKHNLGWAYSLRNIVDNEGNFVCQDNCESLGCILNSHNQYLVDNSCYAVRTTVARKYSHAWHVPVVSDRNFQAELLRAKVPAGTTGKHSVNYRLSKDGTGIMTDEKFLTNNGWMLLNRPDCNWSRKQIFNF